MNEKIETIIENSFSDQITYTADLIKIKSVGGEKNPDPNYPLGKGPAEALRFFLSKAESFGFRTKNISNMVGWAEIGTGEKLYGILVHLDTVPEGDLEKWGTPPFEATIKDGAIYGRGAEDDKGPAACALYALKALKDSREKLNARFRIIAGLDEEISFKCVQKYLETEEIPIFSFSPDASFPLINGEKGILQFSLKRSFAPSAPGVVKLLGLKGGSRFNVVPDCAYAYFSGNTAKIAIALEEINDPRIHVSYKDEFLEVAVDGLSAHAMHPQKGKNAVQALLEVLSCLDFVPNELLRWIKSAHDFLKNETDGRSLGIAMSDEISGALTLNLATINSDGKDLIMRFDMRYPVTACPDDLEETVRLIAKKLGMLLQINTHKKPFYIPSDTAEIKTLLAAYECITGENGKAFTIGGGTYCKAFPNAVSFGVLLPGSQALAHSENEHISLATLKTATRIYGEALCRLNNL